MMAMIYQKLEDKLFKKWNITENISSVLTNSMDPYSLLQKLQYFNVNIVRISIHLCVFV